MKALVGCSTVVAVLAGCGDVVVASRLSAAVALGFAADAPAGQVALGGLIDASCIFPTAEL